MPSNADSVTPADYSELFEMYYVYVQGLLRKMGINDVEDGASEILMKFYAQDFLNKFDPKFTTTLGGQSRGSSFQGFLSGFTNKYALQLRDRQMTFARKIPVRLQKPVGEDESATWGEVYGPTTSIEQLSTIELDEATQQALMYLQTLQIRGTRDLPRVFLMVLRQVRETGTANREEIAQALGVSGTAVCLIFADLRKALTDAGFYEALTAQPVMA